jgi:hypothetical protein
LPFFLKRRLIFIVLEYLVNNGLDNIVLLMLQKDCGDIESGLGLKHDKQIIQD